MKKKTPSAQEHAKLKKWYEAELKRRDQQIDKLKKENLALLKTALKQGLRTSEMRERLKASLKKTS